jgi:hypothetical protein
MLKCKMGCRYGAVLLALLFLALCPCYAVRAAEEPPAAEGQSLRDLARLFGNDSPRYDMPALMSPLYSKAKFDEQFWRIAAQKAFAALAQSYAGSDLTALPRPTGDALFDRYALAVNAQINAWDGENLEPGMFASLPDSELAKWEADFGNDPRYWELRYFSVQCSAGFSCNADAPSRGVEYLREAKRRGIATANTLCCLHLAEEQTHRDSTILDAAVAKDPDYAWAYYLRAMQRFEQGDQERGQADLATGNTASCNRYPRPFPIGLVRDSFNAAIPLGSAVVCGAILWATTELLGSDIGGMARCTRQFKTSLASNSFTSQPEVWENWQQYAWRFACCEPANMVHTIRAQTIDSMIINTFKERDLTALSPAQTETVKRMYGWRQTASKRLKETDYFPVEITLALGTAGLGRGICLANYLEFTHDSRRQARLLETLAALRDVHYPELAMPEKLREYPELSPSQWDHNMYRKRLEREGSSTGLGIWVEMLERKHEQQ